MGGGGGDNKKLGGSKRNVRRQNSELGVCKTPFRGRGGRQEKCSRELKTHIFAGSKRMAWGVKKEKQQNKFGTKNESSLNLLAKYKALNVLKHRGSEMHFLKIFKNIK